MTLIIPREIALGFEGGPVFASSVVQLSGGRSVRNKTRERPIHEYSFAYNNKTKAYLLDLKTLFIEARGQHETVLLWDHLDHELTDEPQGTYPFDSPPDLTFNLIKTYGTTNPWARPIKYIIESTLVVKVDGSPVPSSFSAGVVTLSSEPAEGAAVTASCEFYVPGHLTTDRFSAALTMPGGDNGTVIGFGFIEDIDV